MGLPRRDKIAHTLLIWTAIAAVALVRRAASGWSAGVL